jgi:3-oxoadipate enol-lactonase
VNRGEIGRREFARATAGKGPVATGRVREASPVLAAGVEEFIFADVFSRSGLPARERELLTVAVLAALGGADNQLGVHVPAALECGADPEELIQLCEQITPYAGFPRALNALRAVRAVLEERGLPLPLPVREIVLADHATLAAETGAGETGALLIHPPELDRRMWREVMRDLPDGHHAVAPDLRGAGAAVGAPVAAGAADLASDLVGVMDACGLARAEVVAQGASAALAIGLAAAAPARVSGITLVGPRRAEAGPVPGTAVLAGWLLPATLASDPRAARYARDRLARLDHDGWSATTLALAEPLARTAADLRVRIVTGAHDPGRGDWVGDRPQPASTIDGAGHLVALEAPAALAAAIVAAS